jgi:hypothetical protein
MRRSRVRTAALRVEISDAALVDELAQTLRRCEFVVMRTSSRELEVRPRAAQHGAPQIEGAAELELDLYLKVWEAKHPGVRASRAPIAT